MSSHALRRLRGRLIAATLERRGETRERVTMDEIGVAESEYHEYEPSGWRFLRRALRGIDVGRDDVFVDFGCGKGRVLVQAARRPFGRVIGVELSAELTEQAHELLDADRRRRRCDSVELVVADVTEWEVPDDVTIAYTYNVLRGQSLQRLLDRLVDSVRRAPRRLILVYANPEHEEEVLGHPNLRLLARRGRARWRASDPRRISLFEVERQ